MKTVNMHQAKSDLSRLVREVREGVEREIVIVVDGVPAARLVPYGTAPGRVLGPDHGLIATAPDFDAVDGKIAEMFDGPTRGKIAKLHNKKCHKR
ncbi:MAG TPA: type II toxin-antitoxin system prevent-host-death family antitoxin [Candidatus Acidoferrales bacterium]|nr:type II toxin-antitoxin system prevent-host-death family antitoxin [Candidatus Acidoferrales bacterium]